MDRQEITEELEHPGARNLLASATILRLAYSGSDGFPRVIPIGERREQGRSRTQMMQKIISEARNIANHTRSGW